MNKSGFDFASLQTRGSPLIAVLTQTRQSRQRGDWRKREGREESIPQQRYPVSGKKLTVCWVLASHLDTLLGEIKERIHGPKK